MGTIIARLACVLAIAAAFLSGGEIVDEIKVNCRVVADGEGYAQGIRTDIVNCKSDRAIAIYLSDDPAEMNTLLILDASGRPVSAEMQIKPAVNPPDRNNRPSARHVIITPLSGASLFVRLPKEIRDVTAGANQPLIPTPEGEYRIRCRPVISYVELEHGVDSVPLDPAHPAKYQFLRIKAIELGAKMFSKKMADDWIQQWAE